MDYLIYTFSVPGELLPFYVGKGKPNRPQQHFSRLKMKSHFYNKLNSLLANGIYPEIKVVANGLTEVQAFDLEIKLIQIYGRLDKGTGCLTNGTDGGEGTSGGPGNKGHVGYPHSIDTRIKMSKPKSEAARQNLRILRAVRVESFDLKTGQIIKRYETQKDVTKDGFSQSGVCNAISGRSKMHGKLGWRYA